MTLRRVGFGRYEMVRAAPSAPARATRTAVLADCSTASIAVEKPEVIRSEAYRRLVASMPCKHCGIWGHSQAAHPNTGKGAGLKTDDRECFALCADRPGVRGCHPQFDQNALFSKAVRRALEPVWAADTRRAIQAAGTWPANLPLWSES
jgi:hypothetical protein